MINTMIFNRNTIAHAILFFVFTFSALLFYPLTAGGETDDTFLCTLVIDGDTIMLDNGEIVRLIGVDAPEILGSDKPEEWFGIEAYWFTKKLVEGKLVSLELGRPKRDKQDRLQAYVYLMDGTCINGEIIIQGYGYADRKDLFRYRSRYIKYEKIAKEWTKGLWDEREKHFFEERQKLKRENPALYQAYILGNYEASRRLGAFDKKDRRTDYMYLIKPETNTIIPQAEPGP